MTLEYMDEENLRLQYNKYSELFSNLQKEVLNFTGSLAVKKRHLTPFFKIIHK